MATATRQMNGPEGQSTGIPGWLVPAAFTFYLVVNIISWRFPFFWDTLLVSTTTTWLYDHGWNGGIVPEHIDAGHPPLFNAYLLAWWKAAGRNLAFSHLAMLPVLWTAAYQFIRIAAGILHRPALVVSATGLFCLETTILAQSTMVSPDLFLLCFFLLGLRYVPDRKPVPVALAAIVLCGTNLRGSVLAAALVLIELSVFRECWKSGLRSMVKYVPALLILCGWLAWHYSQTGWLVSSPSEQWSGHRGWPGWKGMLANAAAVIRVHLEPGRLLLAFLTGTTLLRYVLLPGRTDLRRHLTFALVPFILLAISFIPLSNPVGHRYFMVVYAMMILLFLGLVQHWKYRNIAVVAVILCSVSGHFWVYPQPYSNGWDSSLAHLSWFRVDRQLHGEMDALGIRPDQCVSRFPIDVSGDQKYLNGDTLRPGKFGEAGRDSIRQPYVIVSNISNEFGPDTLDKLIIQGKLVFEARSGPVHVKLIDRRISEEQLPTEAQE